VKKYFCQIPKNKFEFLENLRCADLANGVEVIEEYLFNHLVPTGQVRDLCPKNSGTKTHHPPHLDFRGCSISSQTCKGSLQNAKQTVKSLPWPPTPNVSLTLPSYGFCTFAASQT